NPAVLSTLQGTAADDIAGLGASALANIFLQIKEVSPGQGTWDGSITPGTFTLTGNNWVALNTIPGATFSAGVWTIPKPALTDQYTYRVFVYARDAALPSGNSQLALDPTRIASMTFTLDGNTPTPVITYPATLGVGNSAYRNGAIPVQGTVSSPFGIIGASVTLREDTGMYYDGVSTFSSPTPKWFNAPLTGSVPNYAFTYTFPPGAIAPSDGRNYQLIARAITNAGKEGDSVAVVIKWDTTKPAATISSPLNADFLNILSAVNGAATDPGGAGVASGVSGVQLQVEWNGQCWSGSDWSASCGADNSWLGAAGTAGWSKTTNLPQPPNIPPGGLTDSENYTLRSRAFDLAANTQTVITPVTFTFDISSPTPNFVNPKSLVQLKSLSAITGTARDNNSPSGFNVGFPQVRIWDLDLNKYWTGASWDAETWLVAGSSSSSGGLFNWSLDTSGVTWPDRNNRLRLDVVATDEAGNSSTTIITFSFDQTRPDSVVNAPPTNGQLFPAMTSIGGTAFDATTPVSSVTIKMWYLQGPTTYWWTPALAGGKHWTTTDQGWNDLAASLGGPGFNHPWSYTNGDFGCTPPPGGFTNDCGAFYAWVNATHDGVDGKTFYVVTRAMDGAGNFQAALTTRTFTFDNTPPVSGSSVPAPGRAYRSLGVLEGTSFDATSGIKPTDGIKLSIASQTATGYKWFNGDATCFSSDAVVWFNATQIFQSSWTFFHPSLGACWSDREHYVITSSATDNVLTRQQVAYAADILFDTREPTSNVVEPANLITRLNNEVVSGNSSDPGFTSGIAGSGSGVYPNQWPADPLDWRKGKVEILVYRGTYTFTTLPGPFAYGAPGGFSGGFYWDGSTWTAKELGEKWVTVTSLDGTGAWAYTGLDCSVKLPTEPCWVNGDTYIMWVRATDNAGTVQAAVIQDGPKFFISAPPQSFALTVNPDPMVAGSDVTLTVEARDQLGGVGARATSYVGNVRFTVDAPNGPENMDQDGPWSPSSPDSTYGLPPISTFTATNAGQLSFQIRLRKSGTRIIRVEDKDASSLFGQVTVTVNPAPATRLQVVADYDATTTMANAGSPAQGQNAYGGVMPTQGRIGNTRTKVAGANFPVLVQVVDSFYNLVLSSAATVWMSDTDPYNDGDSPDRFATFNGSTTVTWSFASASDDGDRTITVSSHGVTGAWNVSSTVTVVGQGADRLLALFPGELRVQGKTSGSAGKSDAALPLDQEAGRPFLVRVYATDSFYNTAKNSNFEVELDVNSDPYETRPSTLALANGTTSFWVTAVTASTHAVKVQEYVTGPRQLPAGTSDYYTPVAAKVWWTTPEKLRLLVAGESRAGGKPPYAYTETTTGGRLGAPATLTAGVTSTVYVDVVDRYFNLVTGPTPFIPTIGVSTLTSVVELTFPDDPNIKARGLAPPIVQKSLEGGTTSFTFIPVTRTAGMRLTVRDLGGTGTAWSSHTVTGVPVDANVPVALLAYIPGDGGSSQAPADGTPIGKSTFSAGVTMTAGNPYNIMVRSVDLYNNKTAATRTVKLLSNDPWAGFPGPQPLGGGETTFNGFLPSAATGNLVIQAADDSGITPAYSTDTVTDIRVVPNNATRMIVVLPGEGLQGGKTTPPQGVLGIPFVSTAGVAIPLDIYAADVRYNAVPGVARGAIQVTTDDPFSPPVPGSPFAMANGRVSVPSAVVFRQAGPHRVIATDQDVSAGNLGGPHQSNVTLVLPGQPKKLRVLLPTEARVPGDSVDGRSGPPLTQLAGISTNVVVDITDDFGNLVPYATAEIRLTSDDPFAVIVPTAQVVYTSATFNVTFKRAGISHLTASNVPGNPEPSTNVSEDIFVNAGIPRRLLVKLPGETFDQGSPSGKTGQANFAEAGNPNYQVYVRVVDDFYNVCLGRNAEVRLQTPRDAYAPQVSTQAINPGTGEAGPFLVTLLRAATDQIITATDYSASGLNAYPDVGFGVVPTTFTVVPGKPEGLALVLPGQTLVPGSGSYPNGGLTGSISTPTAGVAFNATVSLVDHYMNVYTLNGGLPQFSIETSDPNDIDPSVVPLISGARQVPVTLVTKSTSTTLRVVPRTQSADSVCGPLLNQVCFADAPAARTPELRVYAAAAVKLQVLLPGETAVQGACDVPGVCITPFPATPGKTGAPSEQTIPNSFLARVNLVDAYYNKVTDLTGVGQDSNPPAIMPIVQVSVPKDPIAAPIVPSTLAAGSFDFPVLPRRSSSTYVVTVSTNFDSPAVYAGSDSAFVRVNPGPAYYLRFSNYPANTVAGIPISVDLSAYDQYDNLLSTGPNTYTNSVIFTADFWDPPQTPDVSPVSYTFSPADGGRKSFNGLFTLKKAGTQKFKGADTSNPQITTERVNLPASVVVDPGPPGSVSVLPSAGTSVNVRAGSTADPGFQAITGQLSDNFGNPVQSPVAVVVQTAAVVGQMPSLAMNDGSGWASVGGSTVVFTDNKGRIGKNGDADNVNPQIAIYVSPKAGDSSRVWIGTMPAVADVTPFVNTLRNISASLITIGGTPSKLVVVSSQPAALVGSTPGSGADFVVQRRDDFDNPTDFGLTAIDVLLPPEQVTTHSRYGFTPGTPFSVAGTYGFMDANPPNNYIATLFIPDTIKEMPFRYRDRMASYSGPGPDQNSGYGGRPGRWKLILRPQSVSVASTTIQLAMDPDEPLSLGFGNPMNTLVAGLPRGEAGPAKSWQVQVVDRFNNPRIATGTVNISLATSRAASIQNDSYGFATSSTLAPGFPAIFVTTVSQVTIPLNTMETTFYYLDTTASLTYPPGPSTAPVIMATDMGSILISTSQPVVITPDFPKRIAVPALAESNLLAGATSQAITLRLEDDYGNPSPVRNGMEDSPDAWISFRLYSDSLGTRMFSSPGYDNFILTTGTARLNIGESATTFYLIDTKVQATPQQVWADTVFFRSWLVVKATYTVRPGPPIAAAFSSAERYLIAGTTVQIDPATGKSTDTVQRIQLYDQYGNLTTSTSTNFTIKYSPTPAGSMRGGFDPNKTVQDGPDWFILPSPFADATLPINNDKSDIYVWANRVGTITLNADVCYDPSCNGLRLPSITQKVFITPGAASYITIHHPYWQSAGLAEGATGPLKVGIGGVVSRTFGTPPVPLGITLRDKFGNVAAGHPINGQYFAGAIRVAAVGGSTTSVTLTDLTVSTTTPNMFIMRGALDPTPGVFNGLMVRDTLQETLQLQATAYNQPSVYGYTNDSGRPLPSADAASFVSDPNIFTVGVKLFATDMAPEPDPITGLPKANKQSVGQNHPVLRQGDGNTGLSPDPVQMVRLSMSIVPSGSTLDADLSGMRVEKVGDLNASHVSEIALYHDENGNGLFEPASEVKLGTGAFDGSAWRFGDVGLGLLPLHEVDPVRTKLTIANRNYFIALRLAATGYLDSELPSTLGLRISGPSDIFLSTMSQVGIAANGFAVKTATSPVEREPAQIYTQGTDVNAFWAPFTLPLTTYNYVDQGASFVGVLRLKFWTPVFTATLGRIHITHTGSGLDSDIRGVHLYIDADPTGDPTKGNGIFEFSIDKEVTDPLISTKFTTDTPRATDLILKVDGSNPNDVAWRTISPSTNTYFIVYDYDPAAIPNLTHGVQVAGQDIIPLAGNGTVVPFATLASTTTIVRATSDQALVDKMNKLGSGSVNPVPSAITQNDINRPVGKLTMKTNAGSAIWGGLKMDRWLHSSTQGGSLVLRNKASDVKDIRIWKDQDGNGLLDINVDLQVSPQSGVQHGFPTSRLQVPLTSTDTALVFQNLSAFFPSDDVFANVPQRLVVNDDQLDENLKEVVWCNAVVFTSGSFTNCSRGQEGTTAQAFSTGTVVSASARVPIVGPGGGQTLVAQPADFFVSYDIDPLATVGPGANLGMAIPSTAYFLIQAPKTMSQLDASGNASVGVPPAGRTLSLVANMNEYADKVVVVATNTVDGPLGPFLQQKSTAAVLAFTLNTDIADSLFRWVLVTATGTSANAGTVGTDVDLVTLWRDQNNDGLFQSAIDVLVGSGTFGNSGQPLVSKVLLATPERILKPGVATSQQRYFVAYNISKNAQTTDPFTQQARTLGAKLLNSAFPKNNNQVDEPLANAFSLPNLYDPASPLPYDGTARTLIPAAQTMNVQATPMFTTSSGTFTTPRLVSALLPQGSGFVESAVVITSTENLPAPGPTSYLIVDGEIISYDGMGPGALFGVHRGLLNTQAVAHSVGAPLGPMIEQGKLNQAIMKLEAWSDGFQIQWNQLRMNAKLPPGINVADADLLAVRLWRSVDPSTGPVFHRDPATGLNLTDTLLATGRFENGLAVLNISDPQFNNSPFTFVTSSTQTYYVSIDVSPAAKFSHTALTPPNEGVGVIVNVPSDFVLGPPGAGHQTAFLTPIESAEHPLVPTVNLLNLTLTQFSQPFAVQFDKNVPVAKITAAADRNTVIWKDLRIDRTGSGGSIDTDVTLIRMFKDGDGNGTLDPSDVFAGDGVSVSTVNMMSFGTETFSTGTTRLVFRNPIVISTVPTNFFVTYDFSEFSQVGQSYGLRIAGTTYATVQVPNAVTVSTPIFQTSPEVIVQKRPALVTLGVNDLILTTERERVNQAEGNVPFLRFNMITDRGLATWESIRIERSGGSTNEAGETGKENGRNTDVAFVRVWQDIDQNDQLNVLSDVNINEVETFFQSPIVSTQNPPFWAIVASTKGFPANGVGRLWASGAELMTFSGYSVQTVGSSTYPAVNVVSRGDRLGQGPTPKLSHPVGGRARKVDVFDQDNDASNQLQIFLSAGQTIRPTPSVFFLTFDIGATAKKNDFVGLNINDRSWVGVTIPNEVDGKIFINVDKIFTTGKDGALQKNPSAFPVTGTKIVISPLTLKVTGRTIAPSAATGGQQNIPLQQLTFQTSSDFVNIATLRLTQLGTVQSPPVAGAGRGDATKITVWIDNGDGAFTPNTDKLAGSVVHNGYPGGSTSFDAGLALVDMTVDGIPYVHVTTKPINVFIAVDVSTADTVGRNTVGDRLGISLERFTDMIGPNGAELTAGPDATLPDPLLLQSALVQVSPAVIPLTPIIPRLMYASNGYPAYCLVDSSGNLVLDTKGKPIPDSSRWMVLASTETLIDINGDGKPDNFAYPPDPEPLPPGRLPSPKRYISLDGSGRPSLDLDNDLILDIDINRDGVSDLVMDDGTGKAIFFIGDVFGNTYPVSDQALAINSWNGNTTGLKASWAIPTSSVTGYEMAVGVNYNFPDNVSKGWTLVGSSTTGQLEGLGIKPPTAMSKLTANLSVSDTNIPVADARKFATGKIWIGSEIVGVQRVNDFLLRTIKLDGCPTDSGRGCDGSLPQPHMAGEIVSDEAALVSIRGFTSASGITPTTGHVPSSQGRPLLVMRIDSTPPPAPVNVKAAVAPGTPASGVFVVNWLDSLDPESGAMAYEVQERIGTDPVWRSLAIVPAIFENGSSNAKYQVGLTDVYAWEQPRASGQYLSYRVRTINYAGLTSEWSMESTAVATTLVNSPISNVSNFPNPFDSRKGGPEGKTTITYTLGADSDVTITIYDLLGYVVKIFHFQPGAAGARAGPNFVPWDGRNGQGNPVAKGGYVARIKAGSGAGTATVIRKIGVIH
ncbi:MAG: hypothetical protein HY553_04740, partial [Elusimicrobia bacterium]|nr:hypothetical protein [Elusimicrobiota bacterium]